MNEPQKLATMFPVLRDKWEARDADFEQWLDERADVAMAEHGTVVGEVTREVLHEQEIAGMRLFGEDEDGNPIPHHVMLRYQAMAIPNEGEIA